ncbi:MAG: ferric reductase-like transmembrane domain-containing protein [Chloroflexota bacterium]
MSTATKTRLWFLLYALVLLAPFIVVMAGPRPEPREFWRELSVALGFSGLALLGVQFVPTTRLRSFSNLFDMDEIYYYHRRAAIVGFVFVLAHPLILFLFNPTTVSLLNPLTAPTRAVYGLVSLLALIGLIVTSLYRQEMGIRYEIWRLMHTLFAAIVVVMAMLHILGVSYYLAMPWQRGLWIGLTVLWLGLLVNTRLIRPLRQLTRPYKLTDVQREAKEACTLVIRPDGHDGVQFMPGQFAWLTINRPPFALRQHPFSFASSAESPERLEFTVGELGDFTSSISQLPLDSTVYLDGPHGTFSIDRHDGPGYVFIAGGVGSPPMLSMLRTMADRGNPKPAWLFYGNPTWEEVAYSDDLKSLEQRLTLKVVHVLEEPPEGWEGETGFIDAELLDRYLPANRADLIYFVCGPPPMITAVMEALEELDLPLNHIITEQYNMV